MAVWALNVNITAPLVVAAGSALSKSPRGKSRELQGRNQLASGPTTPPASDKKCSPASLALKLYYLGSCAACQQPSARCRGLLLCSCSCAALESSGALRALVLHSRAPPRFARRSSDSIRGPARFARRPSERKTTVSTEKYQCF